MIPKETNLSIKLLENNGRSLIELEPEIEILINLLAPAISAVRTLRNLDYKYYGGELWEAPKEKEPDLDLIKLVARYERVISTMIKVIRIGRFCHLCTNKNIKEDLYPCNVCNTTGKSEFVLDMMIFTKEDTNNETKTDTKRI